MIYNFCHVEDVLIAEIKKQKAIRDAAARKNDQMDADINIEECQRALKLLELTTEMWELSRL